MRIRETWRAMGPRSSQQGWLNGVVAGYAAGVGLCASIAVALWLAHSVDVYEATRVAPAATPAGTADQAAPAVVPAVAATGPEQKPIVPSRTEKPPQVADAVNAPPTVPPITTPPAISPRPVQKPEAQPAQGQVALSADRFVLTPPRVEGASPCILPSKPWFALADLAIAEPGSCRNVQTVCAINRSLNTALSWAKSPAEAAEQAERDGKLVFLIHVSGNFEDPGFT